MVKARTINGTISCLLFFLLFFVSGFVKASSLKSVAPALGAYTVLYLDTNGTAELDPNPTYFNPAKDSLYVSQKFFNCTHVGDTITVYITVTDTSLLFPVTYYWDTTDVVTVDTIAPEIKVAPNFAMYINNWGHDTLSFADIDLGSLDNCALDYSSVNFNPDSIFSCTAIGTNNIWVSIKDKSGNIDSALVTINLSDTTSPVLSLKSDTLYLGNASAKDSTTFSDIDNGSTDNCGLDSATVNGMTYAVFSCADTGMQKLTVVLWDLNGNSTTDSVNVYVLDTVKPVYTKIDVTVYLNSTADTISRSDFVTAVTGGCYNPVLQIFSDTAFNCSHIQTTNYIKFKYTGGAVDSIKVTVIDTLKPQLALQNDTLYLSSTDPLDSATFSDVNMGSSDNCGLDSATLNNATKLYFTCADTGLNKIYVKLWDVNGNQSSDTAKVYVLDTVGMVYTKMPQTVYVGAETDTVSRNDIISVLGTGCYPQALNILSDTVFDCTDALNSPVYVRFSFGSGNVDSAMVTALDTVRPTLLLKTDTLIASTVPDTLKFGDIDNGSTDFCGLDSAALNGQPYLTFGCADVGQQKVTVQLWDLNGNVRTDSIDVYVLDTVTPVYVKVPYVAHLNGTTAVVSRDDFISNASGGCTSPQLTVLSDTVFDCSDISQNPNYIKFQFSGAGVDSVMITVSDTTPPTLLIGNDTLYLSGTSSTDSIVFADIDQGSYDNCALDSATLNNAVKLYYTCADTGANKVVVKLWDVNGNMAEDSVDVYVLDTNQAYYTKMAQTVYVGSGNDTLSRSDVLTVVSNSCFAPSVSILSDSIFSCNDIGSNPNYLKFQVADHSVDSVMVTALDTTSPVLILKADTLIAGPVADTLRFSDVNNGSFDICGLDSGLVNGMSYLTYDCSNIGTHSINVELYDIRGNKSSGSVLVYVMDTASANYTVVPFTATLVGDSVVVDRSDYIVNMSGGCSNVSKHYCFK